MIPILSDQFLSLVALISPLLFSLAALVSWFQPGLHPHQVKKWTAAAALVSIGTASAGALLAARYGLIESGLLGMAGLGLSIRIDALSMLMSVMIALLGFIVVRFSHNYLDGDLRQGAFLGRLAATIASVQLLVLAGNMGLLFLSWILTSVCLHRLLLFYPDRPGAIVAARKKFILARMGDACLLIAMGLLYHQFGTGNLEMIFQQIKTQASGGWQSEGIELVALLLALAAILKSAQFPLHGWLIEVMETPTPVSALLHAGLLNAGPFLIIRMAFVMEQSTYASLLLIAVGGGTALFASLVFMTQTSVKTALGYSSVAHMGFSLMVCGMGVFPAAMLHLVAHSFYKAHAFLSSGSVIDVVRAAKTAKPKRMGSPWRMVMGLLLALGLYSGLTDLLGFNPETSFSLWAIGAIIVMGLARILTGALDAQANKRLFVIGSLLAVLVAGSFFALESGTQLLLSAQLPALAAPGFANMIFTGILLVLFAATVLVQILAPVLPDTSWTRTLAIHVRNGFYLNTIFDRMVGAYRLKENTHRKTLPQNEANFHDLYHEEAMPLRTESVKAR